jgi:hypothetical protein
MNEEQLLRNSDVEPTADVISEALGAANEAYVRFVDGLKCHDIELEWRYYNDGKAWLSKGLHKWTTSRGTAKETTAFWLSIWDGFFKVTIFMPEKSREEALCLPLDGETREKVKNAKQMGKLKFSPLIFDAQAEASFEAIYTLVDFRKLIK